jgi:hypothetical protein
MHVLICACDVSRSIVVQEPSGVRANVSHWQCHDVHVTAELAPGDAPASVVDQFHVITLAEQRLLALYRVRVRHSVHASCIPQHMYAPRITCLASRIESCYNDDYKAITPPPFGAM